MTRCVFQNSADEDVAIKVETHAPCEDFPAGGVTIEMRSGEIKEIGSALDRKEADVLLHLLAHNLGYALIDERRAKLLPLGFKRARRRRRPF